MAIDDSLIPTAAQGAPKVGIPRRFFLGGVALALAVGFLIFSAVQGTSVYYVTVGELKAQGPQTFGRPVRVSGDVVPGSIQREGATLRFNIEDKGGAIPVVYQGVVPDIFGDQVQVVVEGHYSSDGGFQANNLLAKCPSRFVSAQDGGGSTARGQAN